MKTIRLLFISTGILAMLSSCSVYRRDILFKASKEMEKEFGKNSTITKTPPNYLLSKNDLLEFVIFTNKGEVIIDPTSELMKQVSAVQGSANRQGGARYLIQRDGCADLPILGHTKLDSLTLHQVDSLLAVKYGQFYQDVFVLSRVSNRKVFVLGIGSGGVLGAGMGGMGGGMGGGGGGMGGGSGRATVVELESENVTLIEILAKSGGVGRYSYANRIKVIRGDLKNPQIFSIDLTKWDSFQKSNLIMQPNDIVYIEPLRRGFLEFFSDITSISSILSTVLSVYLITRL
jgi:polysaccharide export outer membrane protein